LPPPRRRYTSFASRRYGDFRFSVG
jgi:hypothetical protein